MQSLKDIEKTIEAEITLRVKAATALSDSYWEWFRKNCKDAWAAKNRGGDFARRSNKSIGRDIGTAN